MSYSLEILLSNMIGFLPQLLAGLVVLVLGIWFAKAVKKGVGKVVNAILSSNLFHKTPVEQSIKSANLEQHLDEIFGTLGYWLMVILSIYLATSIWGLDAVSGLLSSLFSYSPRIVSALIVLFLGALIAGFAETLIKNLLRQVDASTARAAGKITSYTIMIITALIALSEIGIAREFIMVAFTGLIFALSLGFGLAVGLGGQSTVSGLLGKLIVQTKKTKKN